MTNQLIFLHVVLLALMFDHVVAVIGIDTSPIISFQTTFDCLKNAGYGFANVRAFSLQGVDLDLSVKDTLIYAQRAGFKTDLFVRPCRGKSAKIQIDDIQLVIAEQYYDKFWLYLEQNPNPGCKWSTDYKSNCDYVKTMLTQINYFKKPAAFYSSQKFWINTFGSVNACPELSSYPLIYAHTDNNPSFEDFVPFGGWKNPYGKMFQNNITSCGTTISKIYRQSSSQNLQTV